MIDNEDYYVNMVTKAIRAKYPKAEIVSEYVPKPSRFPHIYIRETDNSTNLAAYTLTGREPLANVSYTVDVYSNSKERKKSICKNIIAIIDTVMLSEYFYRVMCNPFPNENDATIYRIIARYNKIDKERN